MKSGSSMPPPPAFTGTDAPHPVVAETGDFIVRLGLGYSTLRFVGGMSFPASVSVGGNGISMEGRTI
jgi:hypothetical protein